MKYSIGLKILALVLAAVFLSIAVCSFLVGILALEQGFYYEDVLQEWKIQRTEAYAYEMAQSAASEYAQRKLSTCPEAVVYSTGNYQPTIEERASWYELAPGQWAYEVSSLEGETLKKGGTIVADSTIYTFIVKGFYWEQVEEYDDFEMLIESHEGKNYYLTRADSPEYVVDIWFGDAVFTEFGGTPVKMLDFAFQYKYTALWVFAASIVLFIACMVYLCITAGKKSKADLPAPKGLNRFPLDLYAAVTVFGCIGLAWVFVQAVESAVFADNSFVDTFKTYLLVLAGTVLYLAAMLVSSFLFACAAQVKGRTYLWWKNSLVGRLCKLAWRCVGWVWGGFRWIGRRIQSLIRMLPLMWQWLVTAFLMVFVPGVCILLAAASYGFGEVFWVLVAVAAIFADIAIVIYGAYAFGTLLRGAKGMAQGDLTAKIETKYLRGPFYDFADELNALADVAVTAARKQMHSERMKTELITNVSHDIKTPLTSIINYVDILQRTQEEEKRQEYLQVLERQAQQMKRLLEDLLEMSKATTGNLPVEKRTLDVMEALNQALGEYADRLSVAQLIPVVRVQEEPVYILADGRLTWRVLNNLLSNVVKYALAGTRVYLEVSREGAWVEVSVKNISREELNVSADALMERFVRGDASRNTEGSGLGLNIAQSLMEAQGGHLHLHVDGDLFKVTLLFPGQQP